MQQIPDCETCSHAARGNEQTHLAIKSRTSTAVIFRNGSRLVTAAIIIFRGSSGLGQGPHAHETIIQKEGQSEDTLTPLDK